MADISISFSTPLAALDCVVLDTETTGLDARSARLVQIGAVRIAEGKVLAHPVFETLVNPGEPIPAASTAIHGITSLRVEGAPRFPDIAGDLARFIEAAVVVGHAIAYDMQVLEREARLAACDWRMPRCLDVRVLAELARPGLAHYDLDRLAEVLGSTIEGRHTAMGDALATAHIFLALLPLLRERGIRTIAEAEAASRDLADRKLAAGATTLSAPAGRDAAPLLARIDSFPYRHRLAEIMSAPPIWCDHTAPVREALALLLQHRISSVLVAGTNEPPGIVTERDILRAVDRDPAGGLALPVGRIASRPLQSLPDSAHVYRAIGRVGRLGIRHLGVTGADGAIVGIVTTRNLLRHRATTAIVLGDDIDAAESPATLGKAWAQLTTMARSLLAEDVEPTTIAGVISAEVCALTRRAAELAEAAMREAGRSAPPVPYAVLVLGSAGRGESLLAADQDNAIVYASGAPDGPEDQWFAELGRRMSDTLDAVGVPYCKGGVMASNAAWRHSVAGWHALTDSWIRRQRPEDLLNVDIFFDATVVHGDGALGEAVLAHAFAAARHARDFLKQLTSMSPRVAAPTSWLGGLKAGADGRIDLKLTGLLPVFSAARVLAIRHGVRAQATPDRLRAVAGSFGTGDAAGIERLIEAHRTVMGHMLAQQLIDSEAGVRLSPRVALARLTDAERRQLKAALQRVPSAYELLDEGRV